MSEQNIPVKSIVEGAFFAAITAVLFVISIYIPLLGTVVSFLCPLPIIILSLRHSLKFAVIATFISGILVTLLAGPFQGFMVLLGFGLLGITLGYGIKKEYSFTEIIILGSIASFVSKIFILMIGFWLLDVNPFLLDVEQINGIITQSLNIYRNLGLSDEQLDTLGKTLNQSLLIIRIALPALLVLSSIVDTFLNYFVARLVLKRFNVKLSPPIPFINWRASKSFFWSYCIGITLIFIGTRYNMLLLNKIGINVQVIFTMIFLICGISLIGFFMEQIKVNNFLKWTVFIIVCLFPLFTQIATWAGMIDVWVDLRTFIFSRKG